jgi:Flp pilus assembly protein TadG
VAPRLTTLWDARGARLSRLRRDPKGAIAVTFALGLAAFIGAAGLATEVGN